MVVFAVGLGVYLARGRGEAAPAWRRPTAGPTVPAPGAAGAPTPAGEVGKAAAAVTAPPGMILVRHPDGTPWFFADARPVTVAAFRRTCSPSRRLPRGLEGDAPVTGVPYTIAGAYARSVHKRLIRANEWDDVSEMPGFVPAPAGLWEWVEATSTNQDRVVRTLGKTLIRPAAGQKDVTFRLARDLP